MATNGIDRITDKILADAQAKADRILADAQAECDSIKADYDNRAQAIRDQLCKGSGCYEKAERPAGAGEPAH